MTGTVFRGWDGPTGEPAACQVYNDSQMPKKLRIGVIFGGRSGEHEVSLRSARSVIEAIDKSKYEVVPIAITKEGNWLGPAAAAKVLPAETQRLVPTNTHEIPTVTSRSLAILRGPVW